MSVNHKAELNAFCQRVARRSCSKDDIVYSVVKFGEQFQAKVKLNVLAGEEYAGALRESAKAAEQEAAHQALLGKADEIARLPPTKSKKPKPEDPNVTNPKTELNALCQSACRRSMTKQDVIYSTVKTGDLAQATVTLACFGSRVFAGVPSANAKAAVHSAAQQAIKAMVPELVGPQAASCPGAAGQPPQPSNKAQLNEALMRILRRPIAKGEVAYASTPTAVPGAGLNAMFQGTVTILGLPGAEALARTWAGEACHSRREAEDRAAAMTLQSLSADPVLGALMADRRKINKGRARGGRANGASGEGGGEDADGEGGGEGGGGGTGRQASNPTAPSGADLPRARITEAAVQGEVLEWKGRYGWIKARCEIAHDSASRNKGRIYVNRKDLMGELAELTQGSDVQFHVYADEAGLGAEEVTTV